MSTTAGGGAAPMIPMGAHAAQESRYRAPSHGAPGPGRGPPGPRARAPGEPRSGGPAANARRGPPSAGHPPGQPFAVWPERRRWAAGRARLARDGARSGARSRHGRCLRRGRAGLARELYPPRSEEHTSELQSRSDLVCRLLLEKKKKKKRLQKQQKKKLQLVETNKQSIRK